MSSPRTARPLPTLGAAAAWLIFLAGALDPSSLARAQARNIETVLHMLSAYEHLPAAEHWLRLGPETVGVLQELYRDRKRPTYVRLRAVRAASFFAVAETRSFLVEVARQPDQNDLFIREALLGLARSFGESSYDEIIPFLNHRLPVVREAACNALHSPGRPEARRALQRRLLVETHSLVREALERALGF